MHLTESRLREIEDRLAKITPKPWAHEWSGNEGDVESGHGVVSMAHGEICRLRGHLPVAEQAANGVFIAEAPNDVAELLAEVRRLRARLGEEAVG
jgi:hypothetical protein